MTNQVGPNGSVTYGQTGTNSFTDATGKTVTVPQFTQTTSYSPGEQAIYDKTEAAKDNLAQLAQTQSGALQTQLSKPFSYTNHDAENYTTDLASQRILPQQAQARADLDTRLVNAGIRPGTAAYDREMTTLDHANTDQMNQLALSSQSQGYNQALQTYNEPINAITGLMSGSQIAAPNAGTSATPQASVGGVDYSGLVENNYQQQVASSNALMGGLFGLAGAGVKAGIGKWG